MNIYYFYFIIGHYLNVHYNTINNLTIAISVVENNNIESLKTDSIFVTNLVFMYSKCITHTVPLYT